MLDRQLLSLSLYSLRLVPFCGVEYDDVTVSAYLQQIETAGMKKYHSEVLWGPMMITDTTTRDKRGRNGMGLMRYSKQRLYSEHLVGANEQWVGARSGTHVAGRHGSGRRCNST